VEEGKMEEMDGKEGVEEIDGSGFFFFFLLGCLFYLRAWQFLTL